MQLRWNPFRSGAISGDVCLVRLCVASPEDSNRPWRLLEMGNSDSELRLREEISSTVKETLGPAFEVRSLTFGRGSLEIIVLIGTAYHVISQYKHFVESIELMVDQLKQLVRRFFEHAAPMHIKVSASWRPGIGLMTLVPSPGHPSDSLVPALVTWYLMISHAGMLAVLLWLLVSRLHP